jgi:hypothetical protein
MFIFKNACAFLLCSILFVHAAPTPRYDQDAVDLLSRDLDYDLDELYSRDLALDFDLEAREFDDDNSELFAREWSDLEERAPTKKAPAPVKAPAKAPATKAPSSKCPPKKRGFLSKRANIEVPATITVKGIVYTLTAIKSTPNTAVAKAKGSIKDFIAKTGDDAAIQAEYTSTNAAFNAAPNIVPQAIAFDKDTSAGGCGLKWMIVDHAKGKNLKDTTAYKNAAADKKADVVDKAWDVLIKQLNAIAPTVKHMDLNSPNFFFNDAATAVTGIIDWDGASKGAYTASEITRGKGKFKMTINVAV